jgi:hypothetical protein
VTSDKRLTTKVLCNKVQESLSYYPPECEKNGPSKSVAKRTIAKETNKIAKEVNKYRPTRGLPPMRKY